MANHSYKYPKLNDAPWLRREYIERGRSTAQIAKAAGAKTANSARQALLRAGVVLRTVSEGVRRAANRGGRCRSNDDFVPQHDVLEGCLLGDGMLTKQHALPMFRRRNTKRDHVVYVARLLSPLAWRRRVGCETRDMAVRPRRGKTYRYKNYKVHLYNSRARHELQSYFARWYPAANGFKRRVPRDLVLTSTALLHWFLDDGSTSWRRRVREDSVILTLCCESFVKADQQRLCRQLARLGITARVTPYRDGTGWRIRVLESSVSSFFAVIGPCPVRSLAYKWKEPVR